MVSTNLCPKRVLSYQGYTILDPSMFTSNQKWWTIPRSVPKTNPGPHDAFSCNSPKIRRLRCAGSWHHRAMGWGLQWCHQGWGEVKHVFTSRLFIVDLLVDLLAFAWANSCMRINGKTPQRFPKNIPKKTAPNWFHQTMTNYTPLKVDGATPKPKYP